MTEAGEDAMPNNFRAAFDVTRLSPTPVRGTAALKSLLDNLAEAAQSDRPHAVTVSARELGAGELGHPPDDVASSK